MIGISEMSSSSDEMPMPALVSSSDDGGVTRGEVEPDSESSMDEATIDALAALYNKRDPGLHSKGSGSQGSKDKAKGSKDAGSKGSKDKAKGSEDKGLLSDKGSAVAKRKGCKGKGKDKGSAGSAAPKGN